MSSREDAESAALDREVLLRVFRETAETARVPMAGGMAAALGRQPREIEASLRRLGDARLLWLAPGTANVWVAPPFCAVPTDFRVRARGQTYWAACVLDSLGIPAALDADADIAGFCADCGEEMALHVQGGALVGGEGIVHFAVPAARWWENIAFS